MEEGRRCERGACGCCEATRHVGTRRSWLERGTQRGQYPVRRFCMAVAWSPRALQALELFYLSNHVQQLPQCSIRGSM